MVSKSQLTATPVNSGIVLTKTAQASAFAKLSRNITINGSGSVFHHFSSGDAAIVEESGLKPLTSTTQGSKTVNAVKFTKKFTFTDELVEDEEAFAEAATTEIAGSFGKSVDQLLAGTGTNTNIDVLGGIDTISVSTEADLYEALSQVSAQDVEPSGWVLSSALYWQLVGRKNALGLPAVGFVGNEADGTLTLLGLPVATFNSSTAVGFVGPFASRAVFGTVAGYPKTTVTDGAITLADGTVRTLVDHNEVAIIAENRLGFRVANLAEFRKLTLAVSA